MGPKPVRRGHAPPVPRDQPGKAVLRQRGAQVVADTALMLQELRGHHGADRVAALVLRTRIAAPVPVKPRDWVVATRLQLTTEHIAVTHPCSMAHQRGGPEQPPPGGVGPGPGAAGAPCLTGPPIRPAPR